MESKKEVKETLLEHYSNEVCSHVEAAISLFFGLIGTLIIMTIINTFFARIVFSLMYFLLGFLGTYFYLRLFYYRKLLEGILVEEPYKEYHAMLEERTFKNSRLIKFTQRISRHKNGEYRLEWAWIMFALAIVVAFSSWMIVVFSL